jgi:23S rRNA pseudouridine2605 synthase
VAQVRVQKFLSEAGLCSRRAAEEWLREGRIRINGEVVRTPGTRVDPSQDQVEVDGRPVQPDFASKIMLMLNKPQAFVCTAKDPQQRRTVFELLPRGLPRVISVGRLDYASEGLLLFTNDGDLANAMMHPSGGLLREYEVKVKGHPTRREAQKVARGFEEQGHTLAPVDVSFLRRTRKNCWYRILLSEGRNREVRRIFEHAEIDVLRLIRTGYGPIELGDLRTGEVRELGSDEIKRLREACGMPTSQRRKIKVGSEEPGPPRP